MIGSANQAAEEQRSPSKEIIKSRKRKKDLKRRWTTSVKPNTNHPKIRIYLSQGNIRNVPITAMIDSGSVLTTISPNTVKRLGLQTVEKRKDIQIRNADGTLTNGGWKESVRAWVDTGVTKGNMELAVLETTGDKFMLGNDWIARYKPVMNWETGKVITNYGETRLLGTRNMLVVDRKARLQNRRNRRFKKYKKLRIPLHEDSDEESESGDIGFNFEWTNPGKVSTGKTSAQTPGPVQPLSGTVLPIGIRPVTPKPKDIGRIPAPAMQYRTSQEPEESDEERTDPKGKALMNIELQKEEEELQDSSFRTEIAEEPPGSPVRIKEEQALPDLAKILAGTSISQKEPPAVPPREIGRAHV